MKRLRLERRLNINATELLDDFYIPGVPVVVTRMAAVRDWPVFQDNKWTLGKLQRRCVRSSRSAGWWERGGGGLFYRKPCEDRHSSSLSSQS